MRAAIISAAVFLSFAISGVAAPKIVPPRTPQQARPGELQAFYGQVKAVDLAARTITLGLPLRYTFEVPAASEITVRHGGATTLDAIKPGAGARVEAVRGVKNWTARKITLEPGATFPDEMSAKTTQGKTIVGLAVANYITYEPPVENVRRNIDFGSGYGLFLLTLRPDGTVASVRPLRALSSQELNERATSRLLKMKFRPGALTEVRMPMSFHSYRRY